MQKNKIVISVFGLCLGFVLSSVQAAQYLSKEEVTTLLSGKTVKGSHLKEGFGFTTYFDANGTMQQIREDGNERKGKWSVQDDGQHCISWEDVSATLCRFVKNNGDGTYTRLNLKGDKEIPLMLWKEFQDGKQLPQ